MRTFVPSLTVIALGVALAAPSQATAQRHGRSAARGAVSAGAANTSGRCVSDCGDYSLAVVSAVMPTDAPTSAEPELVTLVIENRGSAPAPVSYISVAPRTQLAAARHSTIPALQPGERATVQLPVAQGPDGTDCISITIGPAPLRDPAAPHALASATPQKPHADPTVPVAASFAHLPELPYEPALPRAIVAADDVTFARWVDASQFDAIRKSTAFGTLDA